jgi:hypothetical protein
MYYFYFGSTPVSHPDQTKYVSEAVMELLQLRFLYSNTPSFARVHFYTLTLRSAQLVLKKVSEFIERKATDLQKLDNNNAIPFVFHLGLADRDIKK